MQCWQHIVEVMSMLLRGLTRHCGIHCLSKLINIPDKRQWRLHLQRAGAHCSCTSFQVTSPPYGTQVVFHMLITFEVTKSCFSSYLHPRRKGLCSECRFSFLVLCFRCSAHFQLLWEHGLAGRSHSYQASAGKGGMFLL